VEAPDEPVDDARIATEVGVVDVEAVVALVLRMESDG
jgi:hypothetical protein